MLQYHESRITLLGHFISTIIIFHSGVFDPLPRIIITCGFTCVNIFPSPWCDIGDTGFPRFIIITIVYTAIAVCDRISFNCRLINRDAFGMQTVSTIRVHGIIITTLYIWKRRMFEIVFEILGRVFDHRWNACFCEKYRINTLHIVVTHFAFNVRLAVLVDYNVIEWFSRMTRPTTIAA